MVGVPYRKSANDVVYLRELEFDESEQFFQIAVSSRILGVERTVFL